VRLNRTMLYVKDFPRMVAFYTEILGLKPIEETRMENWVEFNSGDARFSLHAIPPGIAKDIEISSSPRARVTTPLKLSFEVEDATRERDRLRDLGVTLIMRAWGSWDVVDPEGDIFGIYSKTL
jgi:catechol 2,3-dioxygenase-like lactoylglutathione lyase family enzyme